MSGIKYVCSLGTKCHTASFLQRNNLKLASYPFDWLYSDVSTVTHCIEDDFKTLLDKHNYIDIGWAVENPLGQCGHLIYGTQLFNHRDMRIDENYYYLIRCVDRFRNLCKKLDKKLFIIWFINGEYNDKGKVIEFNNKFKNVTSNYTLLCITHDQTDKNEYYMTSHNNIDFLDLNTISRSDGTRFEMEEDNIFLDKIILNKYVFKLNPICDPMKY